MRLGRVFVITRQKVEAAPDVVTGTFLISGFYARMLFDYGSMHLFISMSFIHIRVVHSYDP